MDEDRPSPSPTPRPGPKKRRKGDTESIEEEKLKLLQQMSAAVRTDAHSSFGTMVAAELRAMKDAGIQGKVKQKIRIALFEAQEADQLSAPVPSTSATYQPLTPAQMPPPQSPYTQSQPHRHEHLPPQGPLQSHSFGFLRMLDE